MYSDKTLSCKDCGRDFDFTAAEQEFYAEKGFVNEPGRCPECRSARKAQVRGNRNSGGYGQTERQMYPAVCATCGKETSLPFQPTGDRPVYCRDCYQPQPRRNSW
ncbi:MAG: zinc-ribbon domain containing protein [Syntrophomonas sp.]